MKTIRKLLPILLVALALLLFMQWGGTRSDLGNPQGTEISTDSEQGITATALASSKSSSSPGLSEKKSSEKNFYELTEEDLPEDGSYTTKEDVAGYLILYGHLPDNFISKKEAQKAGWNGGSLERFLPGMCIGGDRFGNYEGQLPKAKGRTWTECDINTLGARSRGAERLVFSNDGLIYYTGDHYDSFELIYEEK